MIQSVAEGRSRLQQALDRAPQATPHRARALIVSPLMVAGGLSWDEARGLGEESIAIYERVGDDTGAAMARLMLALAAFFNGELVAALDILDRACHGGGATPLFSARVVTYRGAVLSYTRRRSDDGLELLQQGLATSRRIGDGWGTVLALTLIGLVHGRRGDTSVADQHLREAVGSRLQGGVTAAAVGGLGQLAASRDPRRAVTLFAAADVVRERAGVSMFPPQIAGQLERARDDAIGRLAPRVVEAARTIARSMSTVDIVKFALADEDVAGRRDVGLTARQQEVALLVADGLSNREIAERLHVSVRTVETHVENVLSVLGLRRRVQVAGLLRDGGLGTTDR